MTEYKSNKSSGFSFGFAVHTTNESKSHSASASPHKKAAKKTGNKQSPRKARQVPNANVDNEATAEEDRTRNVLQFTHESVSKLLDSSHLNASAATAIHDLQCSTGIFVLQVMFCWVYVYICYIF